MWSTLARAIIRVYPRPWRERYAGELRDLVETRPPKFGDIVDLVRGCACEWRHDPALQEAAVLIAATALVSVPAMLTSTWLHGDEGARTSRWLPTAQVVAIWAIQAAGFRRRRRYDWWRLRFEAASPPATESWAWRTVLLMGTFPYFEYMHFHFAPQAPIWLFLIGSPAHLFVLMDRFAPRPWFPHPGRVTAAS